MRLSCACIVVSISHYFNSFAFPLFFTQVFLKEHARGLYSAYTNYTVFSVPLYILKTINAVIFACVSWAIMDVDSSPGKFFSNYLYFYFLFVLRAL